MVFLRNMLICLQLICLLIFTGCARSQLVAGISHFRAQDYHAAFVLLMPEAQKGQRDAQYAVGYMYYYGRGVVENRKLAWLWINRSANQKQIYAIEALKILSAQ